MYLIWFFWFLRHNDSDDSNKYCEYCDNDNNFHFCKITMTSILNMLCYIYIYDIYIHTYIYIYIHIYIYIYIRIWPPIDKHDWHSCRNIETWWALKPDQFCLGARAFPTVLKVNLQNSCSDRQLKSPINRISFS